MQDQTSIRSPRLRILNEALGRGEASALASFWHEMSERGTPLIEPIEGDEANCLVTFLWRASEPVAGVRVIGYVFGRHDNGMRLLPESDVWYRSCVLANDVRVTYQFHPQTDAQSGQVGGAGRFADSIHDPLNPRTFVFERDEEDPDGFELTRSVLEMPNAAPQPLNERGDGVPEGAIELHRLRSEILENERRVWVYTPAGYEAARSMSYDLLLLFDGTGFARSPLPTILDNLIDAGAIRPLVAIMPCSISQTLRLKELLLHEPFNAFLAEELIPWARESYRLTDDPRQTVVGGASAGGLAAAYAAFEHPELFGNVLSLSGAFVFAPGLMSPGWNGEHEWLTRQIATSETKPIRFYLSAGTLEIVSMFDLSGGPALLPGNRHLRTVLALKDYEHWLDEFPGAHDMISWQGVIPEGLPTLLGDCANG